MIGKRTTTASTSKAVGMITFMSLIVNRFE